ncbi:MAG: hypothetical protein KAT37_03850 [Candidatus Aenigmarchaeota archaeon]|nr:hypothetical protein [Candidatus Aenigmarchaeota archaeon]
MKPVEFRADDKSHGPKVGDIMALILLDAAFGPCPDPYFDGNMDIVYEDLHFCTKCDCVYSSFALRASKKSPRIKCPKNHVLYDSLS